MLCKIADLLVEVPEARGLAPRLQAYRTEETGQPHITIKEEMYKPDRNPTLSPEGLAYVQSGSIFYSHLVKFGGMMLHASAVALDGEAYLFSGPSGMGKSTHTRLWKECFEGAEIFNDDKPALRELGGIWYAYGTPWCGKDGINKNMKVPLKAICFLRRGENNTARRLLGLEAISALAGQTFMRFRDKAILDEAIKHLESLVQSIPIYEITVTKTADAALFSYQCLRGATEPAGGETENYNEN